MPSLFAFIRKHYLLSATALIAWALAWLLIGDCYVMPGCGNDSAGMWAAILWGSIPCGVILYSLVEFLVPYSERLELWLHRYGM